MKTVSGKIVSTKSVSLSKAANILSNFVTTDNGASQSVSAYLRRASAAFNELVHFKKDLKKKTNVEASTKPERSHRNLEEEDVKVVENGEKGAEGKLRKKKKSEGSLGSEKNDNDIEKEKSEEKKKKKKKKRKNVEGDGGENGNLEVPERKKRRKTEADE